MTKDYLILKSNNLKVGTLGETFGVVRQISGDAKSNFNQSLTNLQFPNQEAFLGELAQKEGTA